jgi:hypothetical protein
MSQTCGKEVFDSVSHVTTTLDIERSLGEIVFNGASKAVCWQRNWRLLVKNLEVHWIRKSEHQVHTKTMLVYHLSRSRKCNYLSKIVLI